MQAKVEELYIGRVLLPGNVFSYYRMCSLTQGKLVEALQAKVEEQHAWGSKAWGNIQVSVFSRHGTCSLAIECVLLHK